MHVWQSTQEFHVFSYFDQLITRIRWSDLAWLFLRKSTEIMKVAQDQCQMNGAYFLSLFPLSISACHWYHGNGQISQFIYNYWAFYKSGEKNIWREKKIALLPWYILAVWKVIILYYRMVIFMTILITSNF